MDFSSLLNLTEQTRTAHTFDPEIRILPEDLNEVLEMSLLAPNHKYTFPWKYLHVTNETREKISFLAKDMAAAKGMDDEGQENARQKVLMPSDLVVVLLEKKPESAFEEREDYATLSCSIQLIALGLRAKGFAYKWSTGGISQHNETYRILNVDKDKDEIIGFIWIGKEAKEFGPRRRPLLTEVVRQV